MSNIEQNHQICQDDINYFIYTMQNEYTELKIKYYEINTTYEEIKNKYIEYFKMLIDIDDLYHQYSHPFYKNDNKQEMQKYIQIQSEFNKIYLIFIKLRTNRRIFLEKYYTYLQYYHNYSDLYYLHKSIISQK